MRAASASAPGRCWTVRVRRPGWHRGLEGLAQRGFRLLAVVHGALQLGDGAAELDLGGGLLAQVAQGGALLGESDRGTWSITHSVPRACPSAVRSGVAA